MAGGHGWQGGHAWWGVHGRGACVVGGGGVCGRGVCMAGGMCGRGHAWQVGVHGKGGMAGGHVWQGACMAEGVCMVVVGVCMPCIPPDTMRYISVNVWAVRVLLECILILNILVAKNHEDDPVKSTTKCNPVIQAYGTRHVLNGRSLN